MPCFIVSKCNAIKNDNYCRNTSLFFSKLANKLLDMAVSIDKHIEKIKAQIQCKSNGGVVLVSIDTPIMTIAIKYEFIEYIKRYGPPTDGKFEDDKLELIRTELGISAVNAL